MSPQKAFAHIIQRNHRPEDLAQRRIDAHNEVKSLELSYYLWEEAALGRILEGMAAVAKAQAELEELRAGLNATRKVLQAKVVHAEIQRHQVEKDVI